MFLSTNYLIYPSYDELGGYRLVVFDPVVDELRSNVEGMRIYLHFPTSNAFSVLLLLKCYTGVN